MIYLKERYLMIDSSALYDKHSDIEHTCESDWLYVDNGEYYQLVCVKDWN